MAKIVPCLWFTNDAEAAAAFYVSLLPGSRVTATHRQPADDPGGGRAGNVLLVEFELAGQPFQALNGTIAMEFTDAVSFTIDAEDQAEVDRLWDAILAGGGAESQCGWIRDRWGVRWQIVPRRMGALLSDPDRAKAKRAMEAMLTMRKIDVAALERAAEG